MILPKLQPTKIEKGKLPSILEGLVNAKFTGFAKIAYRKDELSVAEILFDQGKIIAAEVTKVKSKKSVAGDSAIAEIGNLENIVAEIYALSPEDAKKVFEMNRSSEVKKKPSSLQPEKAKEGPEVLGVNKASLLEKYKITLPTENEIESLIEDALGNSEIYSEIEKQKILEKYGIRKPTEEEIDRIIANALGSDEPEERVEGDFEKIRSEIIEILESRIGKPAKKAIEIISSCRDMRELSQNTEEIVRTLRTLVVFVPRKKVEDVIAEIEQKIGRGAA